MTWVVYGVSHAEFIVAVHNLARRLRIRVRDGFNRGGGIT